MKNNLIKCSLQWWLKWKTALRKKSPHPNTTTVFSKYYKIKFVRLKAVLLNGGQGRRRWQDFNNLQLAMLQVWRFIRQPKIADFCLSAINNTGWKQASCTLYNIKIIWINSSHFMDSSIKMIFTFILSNTNNDTRIHPNSAPNGIGVGVVPHPT